MTNAWNLKTIFDLMKGIEKNTTQPPHEEIVAIFTEEDYHEALRFAKDFNPAIKSKVRAVHLYANPKTYQNILYFTERPVKKEETAISK